MAVLTNKPHLDTLEIEPSGEADASVIWMHGLGADAHDFYGLPPELGLPAEIKVRYIFPNAPQIAVTINQGMVMRAWKGLMPVAISLQLIVITTSSHLLITGLQL